MPGARYRDSYLSGPGGLVQLAREIRGLTLDEVAATIATLTPFSARAALLARPWSDHRHDWRQLARSTPDEAIQATIAGLTAARLAAIEASPTLADLVTLALLGAALDTPVARFLQDNPPRPDTFGFIDGPDVRACVVCGFEAHYQCDRPRAGRGTTCDAHICERHAIPQGDAALDIHYCPACDAEARQPLAATGRSRPGRGAIVQARLNFGEAAPEGSEQ